MTLPIFLCVHLAYGALMAFAMERRMRSEGEIVGFPLVWALVPVAFVSTPMSAVLVRYAGSWFLHGHLLDDGAISYERFQLGLMVGIGIAAGIMTAIGLVFAIAFLSRDARRAAIGPAVVAGLGILITLAVDARGVMVVRGTDATFVQHPAGLVGLGVLFALFAGWLFARARLSAALEMRA
jgi:hypothetical protein